MNDERKVDVEKLVQGNLDESGSLDLENRKLCDDGATHYFPILKHYPGPQP